MCSKQNPTGILCERSNAAKKLSTKLYSLIPTVNLSDIIIDICKFTAFDNKLIHASTNKEPKDNERACITASLMALGTNYRT